MITRISYEFYFYQWLLGIISSAYSTSVPQHTIGVPVFLQFQGLPGLHAYPKVRDECPHVNTTATEMYHMPEIQCYQIFQFHLFAHPFLSYL